MADELDRGMTSSVSEDTIDKLDAIGRKTVKVATSAVLASTLVGALSEPPHTEMMSLPEPVPIVQMYQAVDDDPIDDEDDSEESRTGRWRRILKAVLGVLKYLIVALLLAGSLLLGVLKGCAGVAGPLLLPHDDEQQEQTTNTTTTSDDSTGVVPMPA